MRSQQCRSNFKSNHCWLLDSVFFFLFYCFLTREKHQVCYFAHLFPPRLFKAVIPQSLRSSSVGARNAFSSSIKNDSFFLLFLFLSFCQRLCCAGHLSHQAKAVSRVVPQLFLFFYCSYLVDRLSDLCLSNVCVLGSPEVSIVGTERICDVIVLSAGSQRSEGVTKAGGCGWWRCCVALCTRASCASIHKHSFLFISVADHREVMLISKSIATPFFSFTTVSSSHRPTREAALAQT